MRVYPHLDERLELDLSLGLHVLVLTLTLCTRLLRISHFSSFSRVKKKLSVCRGGGRRVPPRFGPAPYESFHSFSKDEIRLFSAEWGALERPKPE
jgi:hypothetical protein